MRTSRRAGRIRLAVGAGLALLAAIGCTTGTSIRIRADRAPAADFTRYATYAWVTPPLAARQPSGQGGDMWGSVPSDPARKALAFDQEIRHAWVWQGRAAAVANPSLRARRGGAG